jgi:hypothetical protein
LASLALAEAALMAAFAALLEPPREPERNGSLCGSTGATARARIARDTVVAHDTLAARDSLGHLWKKTAHAIARHLSSKSVRGNAEGKAVSPGTGRGRGLRTNLRKCGRFYVV